MKNNIKCDKCGCGYKGEKHNTDRSGFLFSYCEACRKKASNKVIVRLESPVMPLHYKTDITI